MIVNSPLMVPSFRCFRISRKRSADRFFVDLGQLAGDDRPPVAKDLKHVLNCPDDLVRGFIKDEGPFLLSKFLKTFLARHLL